MADSKEKRLRRERLKVALDRLVEIGWIKTVATYDKSDAVVVDWTDKGRERAQQVVDIANEFQGSADDFMALIVVCAANDPRG